MRLYHRIIAADPGDIEAIHALGVVQFERFRYYEALDLLWDAAARTGWAEPVVRRDLGLVLAKLLAPQANARQEAIVAAFAERERARKTEPPIQARVSVVLLTHGDRRMTERAANSIAAQTYRNVELVIADDIRPAATDGARTERIEHAPSAANAAARNASGSYLAFVDASDWLAPNYIELMVAEIARASPLWGFSQVENVDVRADARDGSPTGCRVSDEPLPSQSDFPVDELPSFTLLSRDAGGGSGNLFVPRDLFLRLGGYRNVESHAWDFRVRAAREVEPVVVDQRLYFRGSEHSGGASNRSAHRGFDGLHANSERSDELVAEALSGDVTVTNELCPQHPANRTLVLRAVLRANRGDRVPVPVLREVAAEWRARVTSAGPEVPAEVRATPEDQDAGKVALIVLGVYRSGTSALARVLNLCGAELPERLMAPRLEINPRGFWEGEAIVDLDAQLLRLLGVDWKRVDFTLPQEGPLVDEFLAGAREILEVEYRTGRIIVIKDPRVCLLAPLWHRALEASGYRAAYLVSVRHPLEVARSIARSVRAYGGMPIEQGLAMWQSYMERAEAFVATVDARTVHVGYDQLLGDWRRTVRRIARQLDVSLDVDSRAAEVDAYLQPGMRSQRADGPVSEDRAGARGSTIGSLYARLLGRCEREAAG
jgi:glycosyltransferase involved in cell wall biosynthesis